VKNGQAMVDNTMLEKMRADMTTNTLTFGWLISLNSPIRGFNKFPIMFEWIAENKCLCHVNALLKQANPIEHLRTIYNFCKTISVLMAGQTGPIANANEEYERKMGELMREMDVLAKDEQSAIQDLQRNVDAVKGSNKKMRELLKTMLTEKTNEMVASQIEMVAGDRNTVIVEDWCKPRLTKTADTTATVAIKTLWDEFKRAHKGVKKGDFDNAIQRVFGLEAGVKVLHGYSSSS
jgi:hypothetical protein